MYSKRKSRKTRRFFYFTSPVAMIGTVEIGRTALSRPSILLRTAAILFMLASQLVTGFDSNEMLTE